LKSSVLDSYAVLAFLFNERGAGKVAELFEKSAESDTIVFIAAPNWAEVRYIIERKVGSKQWNTVRAKLLALPMEIIPADQLLAEIAGEIKVSKRLSLADCFAAALAHQKKADLYTGDPEFRAVEKEIKVIWLN